MTTPAANILVITLHGVGSSGSDLAPLAGVWRDRLPGADFASPNAPSPSSFGSGYQWFSVAGVTEENRPARISEARASFDATISAIIEGSGFSGRLDRVALVGFSQGTIMALDAIASGRWPVGAVVGFSGRLASPQPLKPSVSTKVLLVHGSADPVIPAVETAKAAAILQAVGVAVETMTLPGLGHTISAEGAERAADFMSDTLAK
jgi:phospholipase/carboxylesterase